MTRTELHNELQPILKLSPQIKMNEDAIIDFIEKVFVQMYDIM
jgi:hypothetical protein